MSSEWHCESCRYTLHTSARAGSRSARRRRAKSVWDHPEDMSGGFRDRGAEEKQRTDLQRGAKLYTHAGNESVLWDEDKTQVEQKKRGGLPRTA